MLPVVVPRFLVRMLGLVTTVEVPVCRYRRVDWTGDRRVEMIVLLPVKEGVAILIRREQAFMS